jgi:hypothetical protein
LIKKENRNQWCLIKKPASKTGMFFILLASLLFSQCKKQEVYYYGDASVPHLLLQDSLSFSINLESKPYSKDYDDSVLLAGKCVLEGKSHFFMDSTALSLSYKTREVLLECMGQIEIVCYVDHREKHFYFSDELNRISIFLKDLTMKYAISNNQMYVKFHSGFSIMALAPGEKITFLTRIKINKELVDESISLSLEKREFHENDFPGAK